MPDAHAADRTLPRPDGARDLRGRTRMVRLAPRLLAIVGPTATGKSALGIALARRFDGEIVSCDSTAVYRGFDIGTDKVPPAEQRGIPHHMVDVVDPHGGVFGGALRARGVGGDPRDHVARTAADPGRRHRALLSRAHARHVRGARTRRAAAAAARAGRRAARPRGAAPLAGESGSRRRRSGSRSRT